MIAWTLRALARRLGRQLNAEPRYRTGRITAGRTVGAPAGGGEEGQAMTTGIITALWDRGGGAIVPATGPPRPLAFDRSAVAPGGFARLRLGEVVAFDRGMDPSDRARPRAIRVTPLAVAGYPVIPGTP